jgi:hypothetical protein
LISMYSQYLTRIIVLTLILSFTVITISTTSVSAFNVQNTSIDINIEPGTIVTLPISLSVSPQEPDEEVMIDVKGLGQSLADGAYVPLEAVSDTSPYSARPFIAVNQPAVSIRRGTPAEVIVTISVPADEKNGTRYALIQAHTAGTPAVAAETVAIPVFLTLKDGTNTETGEITALAFTTAELGDDLHVTTLFRNTGNHHYARVTSNITITDPSGRVLARASSPPSDLVLIPGQEVPFSVALGGGIPEGAQMLTTRIEKQDGTILAEKREPVQEAGETKENVPPSIPGFGITSAMIAVAGVVLGSRAFTGR